MAKKKAVIVKEITDTQVNRDVTSKGEVWQFGDTNKTFNILQSEVEGYQNVSTYAGYPLAIKNKNNTLSLITRYRNLKTGKIVTITDTILNYFDEEGNPRDGYKIIGDNKILDADDEHGGTLAFKTYTPKEAGEYALQNNDRIYGTTKNDIYTANGTNTLIEVVDDGGNDRYTVRNSNEKRVRAVDLKGNDNYEIFEGSYTQFLDLAGNDNYHMKGAVVDTIITDQAGNDRYTIESIASTAPANGRISLTDNAGNDKYVINNSVLSTNSDITDKLGKDSYNVSNTTNLKITDEAGNDSYTLAGVNNAALGGTYHIEDKKGNDKWTISNGSTSVKIQDSEGNDSWTIADSTSTRLYEIAGNDGYSIVNATSTTINESNGNDKFTIVDSNDTIITDSNGNDKYAVTNGIATTITDSNGNDNYGFTVNSSYVPLSDDTLALSITDGAGKDNYVISGVAKSQKADTVWAQNVYILDNGVVADGAKADSANDSYKLSYVDNSLVGGFTLVDYAGNEKYTLNNIKTIRHRDDAGSDTYNLTEMTGSMMKDKAATTEATAQKDVEKNVFNLKNYSGGIYTNDSNYDSNQLSETFDKKVGDALSYDKYNVLSHEKGSLAIFDYDIGNDAYSFKNVTGGTINTSDFAGDDLYVVNKSVGTATLSDKAGNDIYSVTNSKNVTIKDTAYNYKYTVAPAEVDINAYVMKNTTDFTIKTNEGYNHDDNYNTNIMESVDNYIISNSTGIITDYDECSDSYKFDKLNTKVTIADKGGENDKINIQNAKAKNIVFMADANVDGTLFIYDKANKGVIKVNNYFGYNDGTKTLTSPGEGKIEAITVGTGKKETLVWGLPFGNLNGLKATMAAFFSEGGQGAAYGSIENVLNSTDTAVINKLVQIYSENN